MKFIINFGEIEAISETHAAEIVGAHYEIGQELYINRMSFVVTGFFVGRLTNTKYANVKVLTGTSTCVIFSL